MRADYVLSYTLSPTTNSASASSAYDQSYDFTINSITWNVTGNTNMNPWRIGGKKGTINSETGTGDRVLYSKNAISDNISKIEISHGNSGSDITVNSVTLIVSTEQNGGGTVISSLTGSYTNNTKTIFNRPNDKDWTGRYYKIVYNVTNTSTSTQKYVLFSEAKFYKDGGDDPTPSISLSSSSATPTAAEGEGTVTVTYTNIGSVDAEVLFYESDGSTSATYDWIDAEIDEDNNVYYTYGTNTGAARSAYLKVHQKNSDVYSELFTITQAAKVVTPPTYNLTSNGSYLTGTGLTILAPGNTIYYTITTNGDTPANPTTSSTQYTGPILLSSGTNKIKAIAVEGNEFSSNVASISVNGIDPTSLPFSWAGGGKELLMAKTGVIGKSIPTDYTDDAYGVYNVKYNTNGEYIQIFLNGQPGKVKIGAMMTNVGTYTSSIKLQESADGVDFTDVETFEITGEQYAVNNLETTVAFKTTTRVVRLLFVKPSSGSNVGVGPISITIPEPAAGTVDGNNLELTTTAKMAGWRSFANSEHSYVADANTTIYKVASSPSANKLKLESITNIKKGTPVILKTSAPAETDGTFKITLTEIEDEDAVDAGTNLLKATTSVTDLSTTVYRLGYGANDIGFYAYSSANAPVGIVYIDASDITTPDASRGVGMIFDNETTGIEAISNTQETVNASREIYNLNGQRVANPTKGLYIVNGKKVIIK